MVYVKVEDNVCEFPLNFANNDDFWRQILRASYLVKMLVF